MRPCLRVGMFGNRLRTGRGDVVVPFFFFFFFSSFLRVDLLFLLEMSVYMIRLLTVLLSDFSLSYPF